MKHINYISLLAAGFILAAFPQPGRAFSIATTGSIDLKGNGIALDSFDSADPNYSTNGLYTPLRRKAHGDILAYGGSTNFTLAIGNANIAGRIIMGPSNTLSIGFNGSVGDLPWVDANTPGIQPGWVLTDQNFSFANVALPSTTWLPTGPPGSPFGGSGIAPDGNVYDHVFLLPGDYAVSDNGTIYVATNTTVRIKSTVATFKPNSIYVAGTGNTAGKTMVYLTGTKAVLGTEHNTQSGKAETLQFYGLPSLTDLSYSGNGNFTGVIYAPQANLALGGGGSTFIDFIGSSVSRTVQANGHYHFHFDENLGRIFPFANPVFVSRPQNQTVVAGQNATFSVSATSALPVTYQWSFRAYGGFQITPISGATNNTLTITNATAENHGAYYVDVSNTVLSTANSAAWLNVLPPAAVLSQPFSPASGGIQFDVSGIAGSNYVVLAATNLVDWSPLITNVSPFTFMETNAGSLPARFYRALYLP